MVGLLALGAVAVLAVTQGRQAWGQLLARQGYAYLVDIDNWQRTDRERAVRSPFDFSLNGDLSRIPLQIGEWEGKDVPQTNIEVFILLEPEQYVQRLYRRPDGRYVWLSLIGSHKSRSFHSPQICYDADGWRTSSGAERITLRRGDIYALRLVANKVADNGAQFEQVSMYFYVWPDLSRDGTGGLVLFRVTSPMYGSLEETLEVQKAFIREFFTEAST